MDILAQAVAVCHNAIRELMQGAIASGEYRDLPALVRIAEQMSQTAAKLAQSPEATGASAVHSAPPPATSAREGGQGSERLVKQSGQPKPARRSARSEYPKFQRDGDKLVKIGWSKSAKSPYEHRAPIRVAKALLKAIIAVQGKTRVFTVDALLPLADPLDGTEIPGYQVYLTLAWLRKEGIVRQHGREGYSLLVRTELDKSLEQRWSALPDGAIGRECERSTTS
jgi:hypothetical protein